MEELLLTTGKVMLDIGLSGKSLFTCRCPTKKGLGDQSCLGSNETVGEV